MRLGLKSGFSSSVALAASVACSGSVDTPTGTSRDQDAGSVDGGRSSGSFGGIGTAGKAGAGATGGQEGVPSNGGAGRGGTSTGGMAGGYSGGAGGQETGGRGTGGAENDPSTTGTLTGTCAIVGAYACAGHAQKGQLICTGTWAANGNCAGSNNCDTTPGANAGSCQPIVTECLGKKPGEIVCQGFSNRVTCGPDIVTVIALDTCTTIQLCEDGVCKTPCSIPDGGCP